METPMMCLEILEMQGPVEDVTQIQLAFRKASVGRPHHKHV
jgi:hypothetical protein